jgi:hypothetical protein
MLTVPSWVGICSFLCRLVLVTYVICMEGVFFKGAFMLLAQFRSPTETRIFFGQQPLVPLLILGPSCFPNYSFWVHRLVNRDDRHLLAHAMASDFSVAWQCLSKRTIVFFHYRSKSMSYKTDNTYCRCSRRQATFGLF